LFVHQLLARRLGSVIIGFRALEVIASSTNRLFVADFEPKNTASAPGSCRTLPGQTPPKDRFQSADSPGQIFVQSLHAGFALLSFRRNAGGIRHGSPLIETIEDRPKRC
jgi:hypothetical protein